LSADDQAQLQTLLKKLGRHAESVSCSLKPWRGCASRRKRGIQASAI